MYSLLISDLCDRLELILHKECLGSWTTVVVGDARGQLVLDPEQAARLHDSLAHLTSDTWVQFSSLKSHRWVGF